MWFTQQKLSRGTLHLEAVNLSINIVFHDEHAKTDTNSADNVSLAWWIFFKELNTTTTKEPGIATLCRVLSL